jgi:histidinol phosphatase-like PHP family hydrolase
MSSEQHYLRGVIHCHSHYSFDSTTSISTYLRIAKRHELDFIILTDHDTIAGARALKAAAAESMPDLEVPLAAEYLTDEGDVIAAFIEDEIQARSFPQFVMEARRQNAALLLPHPHVGHRAPEQVAMECDLIEALNCRAGDSKNLAAARLAAALGKRAYAGSDAHFARSITSAIVEVEGLGSLRSSILYGRMTWRSPRLATRWEFGASQLIKSWKRRDPKLALRMLQAGCARVLSTKRAREIAQ